MLVFSNQSLAFIAVPKTGTTAVEMALKPRADIIFTKQRKHMPAHRFHSKIAPFLDKTFNLRPDCMAVMRDPVEQIRSWYRYRTGERQKGTTKSTFDMSFDEFVLAIISDEPPAFAGIGSQFRMVAAKNGDVLVHHLFAYETQPLFRAFLNDRFGEEIKLKQKNVSPDAEAPLDPQTHDKLREARKGEFELYSRLRDAGGHLITSLG